MSRGQEETRKGGGGEKARARKLRLRADASDA